MHDSTSRRSFLQAVGAAAAVLGMQAGCSQSTSNTPALPTEKRNKKGKVIQGFDDKGSKADASKGWKPFSDRKLRVGIAGFGVCQFGAAFGFQNHPNVEVVAVTDLDPEKCARLAERCFCKKTYPSCEEMIKDDKIEAVFIATDAPSHARLAVKALKHGKHVASAVPAVFGSLEDADELFEAVKTTGMKYMMFETSYFHEDLNLARNLYQMGRLGKLVYTEGEYFHYMNKPLDSYNGWRIGIPPQFYPTHSNAYYVGCSGGSFTEVSCMGMPSLPEQFNPNNNTYKNPFGTEIALFRTSEGGMSRMAVSWDTPGDHGEKGRIRGQKGSVYEGKFEPEDAAKDLPQIKRPPLPPSVPQGSHGGSHGYLMNDFVESAILNRKPLVDVCQALAMTVGGIVAHHSAMKDGELLKIPQYKL